MTNLEPTSPTTLDVEGLGQVFTPKVVVDFMLSLRKNRGICLEPSAGDGAFTRSLSGDWVGIELDPKFAGHNTLTMDFFEFDSKGVEFETIIGNPPYVKFGDIYPSTRERLDLSMFDKRSNLYLFFIKKSIDLLADGGELIFIVPRDFLKVTSSKNLNQWMFEVGNITHFVEMGDNKIFDGATPNVAIFRFVKGATDRVTNYYDLGSQGIEILQDAAKLTWEKRHFSVIRGQIVFPSNLHKKNFSDYFFVKVGAVSGADPIFISEEHGDTEFVYSGTFTSGRTRKMIFNKKISYLEQYKEQLINRRIKSYDETNWWMWGRDQYHSSEPRVYVNQRTRNTRPFFTHECNNFDGAILAIFPKFEPTNLGELADTLNSIDWHNLGFVIDGRFIFSQRSLENCPVSDEIAKKLELLKN